MNWASLVDWWSEPGVSEFTAAIVGAVIGSLAGGLISWRLQAAEFRQQHDIRDADQKASDSAHLLSVFYAMLQASSDLHKMQAGVHKNLSSVPPQQRSQVPGLSGVWKILSPRAPLPEPVSVSPDALNVLMRFGEAEKVMNTLNVAALHGSAIKLWRDFADSKRRFGEKVSARPFGEQMYTPFAPGEIEKLYPHMKELSDLADGVCAISESGARESREFIIQLAPFISEKTGIPLQVALAD